MYESLKKLYSEFSLQEKRRLLLIACIIVISALVQVVGIASIFPFISAATDPQIVDKNIYLHSVKSYLSIDDNRDFIVLLGFAVLLTLILTNLFLAFSTWVTMRFVVTTNQILSIRLLDKYLNETYLFHLERNSSELLKNLTNEVNRVVNGGIMSSINIVSKGFTTLCILALLILVDPIIALIVGFVLGSTYAFIYWSIRLRLQSIGLVITKLFSDKMRYVNESLGGIKELKVLGREHFYLKQFQNVSQEILKHQVFNRAAVDLPKYLLETIAFGGILAITIYMVAVRNDAQNVLPMISLYGLAGYRLMPALQGIFHSTATLKHDIAAVDLFFEDIQSTSKRTLAERYNYVNELENKTIPLNSTLSIDGINFTYPKMPRRAIKDLSITIKANTSVGIVGTSGSGKSTLIDIILGLIEPQQGEIMVDGKKITQDNVRLWQNNIGYVPQVIFLADSSVSENIAFGVPATDIEHEAVVRAAKMANLHEFILDELEEGYQTLVGERGIRLSGGQRQRIGIARALYHNPSVLILDEATSALDTPTEQAVMQAVYDLAHKKTIIMIAHRISTLKSCDQIVIMEKGRVVDVDSYDELIKTNTKFKRLANTLN